jgi:antitoxin (DNA-binding transcriptional repressor) of toxin-antitoxin stability system
MRAVGVKALKNRLSEYLRLVAAGETVLVTDHDRVVAELAPPTAGRAARLEDAWLAEAVREGWLTPPLSGPAPLPDGVGLAPLSEILESLATDREEG